MKIKVKDAVEIAVRIIDEAMRWLHEQNPAFVFSMNGIFSIYELCDDMYVRELYGARDYDHIIELLNKKFPNVHWGYAIGDEDSNWGDVIGIEIYVQCFDSHDKKYNKLSPLFQCYEEDVVEVDWEEYAK